MSEGRITVTRDGAAAHVCMDNPSAHNALTSQMWLDLRDAAREFAQDRSVRVVTFRGAGGKAFVSGTDISKFAEYEDGRQGVAYEREIDECMGALDAIPCTTIAVVEGWAVGGGINIASACDFRIATPDSKFGSPIGRTIGNCLSAASVARIGAAVGVQFAKRMVLLGEMLTADQLYASGFLLKLVERENMDAEVAALCEQASANAPLTTHATKETIRRMVFESLPDIEELIAGVYGSADFRRGVADFLAKTRLIPDWTGQ